MLWLSGRAPYLYRTLTGFDSHWLSVCRARSAVSHSAVSRPICRRYRYRASPAAALPTYREFVSGLGPLFPARGNLSVALFRFFLFASVARGHPSSPVGARFESRWATFWPPEGSLPRACVPRSAHFPRVRTPDPRMGALRAPVTSIPVCLSRALSGAGDSPGLV